MPSETAGAAGRVPATVDRPYRVVEWRDRLATAATAVKLVRPGDRVFFEPEEDHWHGASPDRFMTHLSMVEVDGAGQSATWGAHVTEEEYRAAALHAGGAAE